MDMLIRFGLGTTAYLFQQNKQVSIDYNFADTLQQSVRVIGKDGAINPYGTGRAPAEMGNLSVSYIIEGNDSFDVGTQIDMIRALAYQGMRKLFMQHRNGRVVWTWAHVSNVRSAQNVQQTPHLRQVIQLNFQCPDSKWYYAESQLFMNDGHVMDGGLVMPPIKLDQSPVADTDTVTVTNYGIAPVSPYIRWDIPAGVTVTNPTITWNNEGGETVYSILYSDTLTAGDVVIIDCRKMSVSPTFSNLTVTHGAWLEIAPGAQTLTISGTFSADANLTIHFDEAYI